MKSKNVFFLTALSSLFLFSCSDDDNDVKGKFDGKPVKFNSEVIKQSRASGTQWGVADAIGVYMKTAGQELSSSSALAENKKHTTPGDGTFAYATPDDAVYFPADGSSVDFIAYYPHQTTITDYKYPVDLSGDQNNRLEQIDLLYSNNVTGKNIDADDVTLGFTHQLATIVLDISEKKGKTLAGMVVTIEGMKTKSSFSLADATFADNNESVANIIAVTETNNNRAAAQAIILPATHVTGAKITFNVPSHSKTYTWKVPEGQNFESKKRYEYEVELTSQGGLVVLNPSGNITDWETVKGDKIILGEESEDGGDGTQANPYTVDQLNAKVGETGKWVTGYIVGSTTKTRAVGTPSTENILLAATATETDEKKCIPVDISSSAVKTNLDIVANPTLIGKQVKVQGDIVNNIFGNTLSMTNIAAQEGGVTGGGDTELKFEETFGPTWREDGQTGTLTKKWDAYIELNQFDMKAPIAYSTGSDAVDFRSTASYDNPHVWFAANYNKSFKIEGIGDGFKGMKLTYSLAGNKASSPANGILVKCNNVDVDVPATDLGNANTFSTITIDIPDGTTTVEFYSTPTSNPSTFGYRIDNIKITGTK